MEKIVREEDGNKFRFGDWTIEAEMNPGKPASLHICNPAEDIDFRYEDGKAALN